MRPGLGQPGPLWRRQEQGWWRRALAGVKVEAGASQIHNGTVEGCVDKPGPRPEEPTKAGESAMAVMD